MINAGTKSEADGIVCSAKDEGINVARQSIQGSLNWILIQSMQGDILWSGVGGCYKLIARRSFSSAHGRNSTSLRLRGWISWLINLEEVEA